MEAEQEDTVEYSRRAPRHSPVEPITFAKSPPFSIWLLEHENDGRAHAVPRDEPPAPIASARVVPHDPWPPSAAKLRPALADQHSPLTVVRREILVTEQTNRHRMEAENSSLIRARSPYAIGRC
ncbi:hypothetical protein DL769_005155 [Monosporascus sp. CRB-8-3]|nr:hypothetical protein DL769_005155 [Monosporascus sp. CRB-8-3]